jgi:hypothetical protein
LNRKAAKVAKERKAVVMKRGIRWMKRNAEGAEDGEEDAEWEEN